MALSITRRTLMYVGTMRIEFGIASMTAVADGGHARMISSRSRGVMVTPISSATSVADAWVTFTSAAGRAMSFSVASTAAAPQVGYMAWGV